MSDVEDYERRRDAEEREYRSRLREEVDRMIEEDYQGGLRAKYRYEGWGE